MKKSERELVDYIRDQLHKGISRKQVRAVLLRVGHSVDSINVALDKIHAAEKKNNILFGAIAAVALLMVLGWIFFGFIASQPTYLLEKPSLRDRINASGDDVNIDKGMQEAALESGDVELCEGAGTYRDNCVISVSVDTQDEDTCKLLEDNNLRATCYYKIAISLKTISLCSLSGKFEEQCMSEIALLTYNPEICSKLTEKKDSCFNMLALLTKNKALCEQAGQFKHNCVRMIG